MSIQEAFKLVPVEPTAEMIEALAADIYPDDNQAGKHLQRLRGTGVVFPKYEIESAVGKYGRMLDAAPTPPQPICDEAKERELFESFHNAQGANIEFECGRYDNMFVQSCWEGWLACAQSRAKSVEVGDE